MMFYAVAYQKRRTKDKDTWSVISIGEKASYPSKVELDKFLHDNVSWILDKPKTWKGVLAVYDSDTKELIRQIPLNG